MTLSGLPNLPQEYTVNVALADLLDHQIEGLGRAVPENRTSPKNHRFDVKVTYKDVVFVLEAAYDELGAEMDAKKRLEEGFIDTVSVAIHYEPAIFNHKDTVSEIKNALISNSIKMRIFTQGKEVSINLTNFMQKKSKIATQHGDWIYVDFNQIMQLMDSIIEFLVTEDTTAEILREIEYSMQDFSNTALVELGGGQRALNVLSNLRHILFSPEPESGELEVEISDEIVLFHTYVTLFFALLLYESIFRNYDELSGIEFFKDNLALDPLKCLNGPFAKVNDDIDYESVFSVALQVISALRDISPGGQIASRLRNIKDLVQKIFANRALLRQDFIGKVYHRVTGDLPLRKGFATYYTKAEIAAFLSELVVNHYGTVFERVVGADGPDINYRIGDFSCGSGTLLSAVYSSVLGKFREFHEVGRPQLVDFHHKMIEHILWGIDALENSVQAASVVLALHEPGTPLENFNTLRYPIRTSGELGSISLWNSNTVLLKRKGVSGLNKEKVSVPMFNFIISNPPFSRNTAPGTEEGLRPRIFGFVTNETAYNSLIDNYKRIIGEMEEYLNSSEEIKNLINSCVGKDMPFKKNDVNPLNSGAFFPFVVLYEKFLTYDGILALVLPISVLEASSNLYLRALMVANFSVDFIIVSNKADNQNFSYSTNLSECLIVLRKTKPIEDGECNIIRFIEQPKNTLEGILIAKKIARDIRSKEKTLNVSLEIGKVKQNSIKQMLWNWSPLIRFPKELLSTLDDLLDNKILGRNIPMTQLGTLLSGSNKGRIANPRTYRAKFLTENMSPNNGGPYKYLYEAGHRVFNRILLRSDYKMKRYNLLSNATSVARIHTGHIVIPESFRFNTMPLFVSYSQDEIISGVAYAATTGKSKLDKAIVAWLNSIFGILMLRTFFSTVQGNFGHIRGWHLRNWIIPEFSQEDIINNLESVFNKYSLIDFPNIPEQLKAGVIDKDSNRRTYDREVIFAISPDLNNEEVDNKLKEIYSALISTISS